MTDNITFTTESARQALLTLDGVGKERKEAALDFLVEAARESGHKSGYESGREAGYESGYLVGFETGYDQAVINTRLDSENL